MGISREKLNEYLNNSPLIQTIEQKQNIDDVAKELREVLSVMKKVDISKIAIAEVENKLKEYQKISHNYAILLEDTWGITWQIESVICKELKTA